MRQLEKIREHIIYALLNEPILGKNYIDYHTDNPNECCVELLYPDEKK